MSDFAWPACDLQAVAAHPGVYLFKDSAQKVLYVGKARDLKSRLATYKVPGGDGRINLGFLEGAACALQTIITRTEQEALLLEDQLIKVHKPAHNIRLKDDKSFLMLRLDDERFPRLKFVRAHRPRAGKKPGRSRLFGPFASSRAVRRTISDLHRVVPLRDCSDAVLENRTRPCLKHQMGMCSAPCVDLIDTESYAALVERAARILSGDVRELQADLEQRMANASAERDYELAGQWRDRLQALRRTVERQGVLSNDNTERDVLGLARSGPDALIHRIAFRGGRLQESRSHLFRSELPDEELMHVVLTALYAQGRREVPREIIMPCEAADVGLLESVLGKGTKISIARGGERGRSLDVAAENAQVELRKRMSARGADHVAAEELIALTECEGEGQSVVVDCFDISNLQSSHMVASRVRFRGGISDRAGYRRFKIKTVDGQDDFASMYEVVGRSLKRGMREGDLPELIVIDGGAAQLAKALEAREDAGAWTVTMVGLAKARPARSVKGQRLAATEERLFLHPDADPIELPKHSAVRKLLERIRNEAHRFAITYHRKERGRITSKLDSIPGVGAARRKALLRSFGSVVGVSKASVEEILRIPGISPALAKTILEHLTKG